MELVKTSKFLILEFNLFFFLLLLLSIHCCIAQTDNSNIFKLRAKFILLDQGIGERTHHFDPHYLLLFQSIDTSLCHEKNSNRFVVRSPYNPYLKPDKTYLIELERKEQYKMSEDLKSFLDTLPRLHIHTDCTDYFLQEHIDVYFELKSYEKH